jgi:hypothetical protein
MSLKCLFVKHFFFAPPPAFCARARARGSLKAAFYEFFDQTWIFLWNSFVEGWSFLMSPFGAFVGALELATLDKEYVDFESAVQSRGAS